MCTCVLVLLYVSVYVCDFFTLSLFHSRLETHYLQRMLNYMHKLEEAKVKIHSLQQHLDVTLLLEQMNTLHIEMKEFLAVL